MSKFCRYCGKQVEEGAKFCRHCGKSLGAMQMTTQDAQNKARRPKIQTQTGAQGIQVQAGVKGTQITAQDAQIGAQMQQDVERNAQKQGTPSTGSFYLLEFFKSVTRQSNIPVFIYLILNVFIIGGIVILFTGLAAWQGLLAGIALYLISLTIALSPAGEWLLRKQTKCKEIQNEAEAERLLRLFQEVYDRARKKDPSLPLDIKLYICDEGVPNAFTTGRKTVCVTAGLAKLPDNEIKATLGHEFGHLSHHDTDLILVVSVGNMIISAMVMIIRVLVGIGEIMAHVACAFMGGEEGLIGSLMTSLSKFMFDIMVMGAMWVWTKLGVLLVMKSSRDKEFEADHFSAELGYGTYLCSLLDMICGNQKQMKGLFANLASSHPGKDARILKLRQAGVQYNQCGML
ncbi:MAG: M48 family metalloprotease [Schaedlerella sp.]|nr:M48 family metalloprotease [Lachnospiraceae bacterium]MDY4202759.1 M48 family metalloprotease [Schaedlerella sp.]